jgi:hypothetical protein
VCCERDVLSTDDSADVTKALYISSANMQELVAGQSWHQLRGCTVLERLGLTVGSTTYEPLWHIVKSLGCSGPCHQASALARSLLQ